MYLLEIVAFPLIHGRGINPRLNTRIFGALFILLSLFNFYLIIVDYRDSAQFLTHSLQTVIRIVNLIMMGWGMSSFLFLGVLALKLRFPRWLAYSWCAYFSLFLITLWLVTVLGWGGVPAHFDTEARGDIAIGYFMLAITAIATPVILIYRDYRYRKSLNS